MQGQCNADQSWSDIELVSYITIVFRNSRVSYSVLLTALLYLLRLRQGLKTMDTTRLDPKANSLPLTLVTSLVLANKFLQDRHPCNAAWSIQTGISPQDICRGEMFFLEVIEHRLVVEPSAFQKWISLLFHPANLINHAYQRHQTSLSKRSLPRDFEEQYYHPQQRLDSYRSFGGMVTSTTNIE